MLLTCLSLAVHQHEMAPFPAHRVPTLEVVREWVLFTMEQRFGAVEVAGVLEWWPRAFSLVDVRLMVDEIGRAHV